MVPLSIPLLAKLNKLSKYLIFVLMGVVLHFPEAPKPHYCQIFFCLTFCQRKYIMLFQIKKYKAAIVKKNRLSKQVLTPAHQFANFFNLTIIYL